MKIKLKAIGQMSVVPGTKKAPSLTMAFPSNGEIDLDQIFTDEYIRMHSDYESFSKMVKAFEEKFETKFAKKSLNSSEWEFFLFNESDCKTWNEFLTNAVMEYMESKE